jgi:hypothetical protein
MEPKKGFCAKCKAVLIKAGWVLVKTGLIMRNVKILSTKPKYIMKKAILFFSLVAVILIIGALLVYRVFVQMESKLTKLNTQ